MIRNLDASDRHFLNALNRVNERMEKAQQRISTGLRVTTPSDDPDHVSALLSSRSSLETNEQIQLNLARYATETNTAEQAIGTAVKLVERARSLAVQGANGTATAESRAIIANEVDGILEQLVNIAGTSVEGRYIFSGDRDNQAPYSLNLTGTPPQGAYAGSAATRQAEHPSGLRFRVSMSAQDIFDDATPGASVFAAVDALRTALRANDETAVANAAGSVRTAGDHLNAAHAWYGFAQNKVTEATDAAKSRETALRVQIGKIEDADVTGEIAEFNQARVNLDAALTSRGAMPRRSLFDYLA